MKSPLKAIGPIRLRTQMALSMVVAIMLAVAFGYVGLTAWGEWTTARQIAQLSAPARRALKAIETGRSPTSSDLAVLSAEAEPLNAVVEHEQNVALAVLTLIASMVGIGAGVAFAGRLTLPLEALAGTARAVAAGDLSARARPQMQGAGETAQLIKDFNVMAEALEATDRQLKESSAAIAHELRTPLTILRGRLQGLKDGVFVPDDREISGLIGHVDSLSRIVDDLRTISTADAGALVLRVGVIDLADEIDEDVRSFGQMFSDAGLQVELDLRSALALADPARVRQVLLALLENARRHAGEGGVVRVETDQTEQESVLRVLDRGPGFADHAQEFAFQPFWRADVSRSRDSGGTGLGLAVVAAIMKSHGGTVEVANRAGGGASVTLRFNLPPKDFDRLVERT